MNKNHTHHKNKVNDLVSHFDHSRTIFSVSNNNINKLDLYKNIFGLLLFIIICVILIPYLLLINDQFLFCTAYFSNLDMVATVLGFSGGPFNIWQYLYNPAAYTLYGTLSSMFINYLALIGVGYTVISYALQTNDLHKGLAKLLVIIPVTYLLPGNVIVYFMNTIAGFLHEEHMHLYVRWIFVFILGLILVVIIIIAEQYITILLTPFIIDIIEILYNLVK